jgi:hypothetical protein
MKQYKDRLGRRRVRAPQVMTEAITVRVDLELHRALSDLACRLNVDRAWLVRRAIEDLLESPKISLFFDAKVLTRLSQLGNSRLSHLLGRRPYVR